MVRVFGLVVDGRGEADEVFISCDIPETRRSPGVAGLTADDGVQLAAGRGPVHEVGGVEDGDGVGAEGSNLGPVGGLLVGAEDVEVAFGAAEDVGVAETFGSYRAGEDRGVLEGRRPVHYVASPLTYFWY